MQTFRSSRHASDRADDKEDEDPSTQIQLELKQSITQALSTRRPILTHLNADTTWLLSLPYPQSAAADRIYFHILIDPWLRGSQSDVAKFFSEQWHNEDSKVQTIIEVEDVIKGIEDAALGSQSNKNENAAGAMDGKEEKKPRIDAVIVSHEFTDHMHRTTLLEIAPSVPIFATQKAASIIRSWSHFTHIHTIPSFQRGFAVGTQSELPAWLAITRIAYEGQDLLYYHSAIVIAFTDTRTRDTEAVIYTPHGISVRDIGPLLMDDVHFRTLALLHGLQDISLPAGAQLNLGAHNGLRVLRLLGAKYWVGTNDEVKRGGGIVSWFLRRRVLSVKEAVEREKEEGLLDFGPREVRFEEVGNGESIILE